MKHLTILLALSLTVSPAVVASDWEEDPPVGTSSNPPSTGLPPPGDPLYTQAPSAVYSGSIYPPVIAPVSGNGAPPMLQPMPMAKKQTWIQKTNNHAKEFVTSPVTWKGVAAGAIGMTALLLLIKQGKKTDPDVIYIHPKYNPNTGLLVHKSYWKTKANGIIWDNFSTQGNINPYTEQPGYVNPSP